MKNIKNFKSIEEVRASIISDIETMCNHGNFLIGSMKLEADFLDPNIGPVIGIEREGKRVMAVTLSGSKPLRSMSTDHLYGLAIMVEAEFTSHEALCEEAGIDIGVEPKHVTLYKVICSRSKE